MPSKSKTQDPEIKEEKSSTSEPAQRTRHWSLTLLMACLSGLFLSVCFPGMGDTGVFVFLWAIPLFYTLFTLQPTKLLRKGFAIGYLCGLTFWLLNLKWLLKMADLSFVPPAVAILAWAILPVYLSLYFGVFGAIVARWGNPWREPKPKVYTNRIDARIAEKLKQEPPGKIAQSFRESMLCLRFAFFHASLWAILEWARSVFLTGFSWNGLGTALYDIPVLAQTAELVGVVGLSFFPMFFCSVILQLLTRMVREASRGRMKPHWDMGVAGLLIATMFGFGVMRLYDITRAPSKDVGVLLVQQNLSLAEKHSEDKHMNTMMAYGRNTQAGLKSVDELNEKKWNEAQQKGDLEQYFPAEEKVDFVLWPESSLLYGIQLTGNDPKYSFRSPLYEEEALKTALQQGSAKIITGCNEYHLETPKSISPSRSFNSIAVVNTVDGNPNVETVYQKNHLVMFGEYIPLRETFPFLERLLGGGAQGIGPNFLSGGSTEPIKVEHQGDELQLIGSVCFEDTVGRLTRHSVRSADQMIVNVTNDGWFGESEEPRQHFANALFRTIELRRPMVRSANTGISCVINAKGSIINEVGEKSAILGPDGSSFVSDTLFAKVRVLTDGRLTLYAIAGDWFIVLCGVIFVTTLVSTLRKRAA